MDPQSVSRAELDRSSRRRTPAATANDDAAAFAGAPARCAPLTAEGPTWAGPLQAAARQRALGSAASRRYRSRDHRGWAAARPPLRPQRPGRASRPAAHVADVPVLRTMSATQAAPVECASHAIGIEIGFSREGRGARSALSSSMDDARFCRRLCWLKASPERCAA